jgi:phytoene synthase
MSAHPAPQPPSSLARAALAWTPADERTRLLGWLEWARQVAAVAHEVHDPGVAQAKLQWWMSETRQAHAGQAQHPLLKSLGAQADAGPRPGLDTALAYIQGWADDLQQARHLDERSVLRHAEATGGHLAAWCTGWVSPPDAGLEAYARAAGRTLRLAAIVRRLGLDAARGALYIPIDDLQRFDIKAHQILSRGPDLPASSAYQALMQHQHARVREQMAQARDLCPTRLPLSCSALPIWLDLEEKRLALVAGQRYAVLDQIITLTPLQLSWHAGRSRWRWRRTLR